MAVFVFIDFIDVSTIARTRRGGSNEEEDLYLERRDFPATRMWGPLECHSMNG